MPLHRLSVDESCKDGYTCPAVFEDTDDPDHLYVVGVAVPDGKVPVGTGEIAVRLKRQVVADAHIA